MRVLRDHNFDKLVESLKGLFEREKNDSMPVSHHDYLILPRHWLHRSSLVSDLERITSASFLRDVVQGSFPNCNKRKCPQPKKKDEVYTKNGFLHRSVLENCLVCTPHNGYIYSISGFLDGMDGNSLLSLSNGEVKTYKSYYKIRYVSFFICNLLKLNLPFWDAFVMVNMLN